MLTTLPVLLVLAACSDYVLAVIGPEWEVGADAIKLLCVVGIVKGLVHFTGPLLFAVARPLVRAPMLWAIAAINLARHRRRRARPRDRVRDDQLLGMSLSRAPWSRCSSSCPLNLVIIRRLAGISFRSMAPWAVAPTTAGVAVDRGRRGHHRDRPARWSRAAARADRGGRRRAGHGARGAARTRAADSLGGTPSA